MSYNDQQQNTEHLLIWLNAERLYLGQRFKFYSLDQVQQSNTLPLLLLKIHPTFFNTINDGEYEFKRYTLLIEKYLLQVEDLKIKRRYRQDLFSNESVCEILRLILFLVMRSEKKQQFVSRILQLDEKTQVYLMNDLKKAQNNLQNNMQVKQIFSKIEELQEENQQLHNKLKQIQKHKQQIISLKNHACEDNERLHQLNKKNKQQKTNFMQNLGIVGVKDYLTVFKDLEIERDTIFTLEKEVQISSAMLIEANHQMEEKTTEDKQIIQYLTQEISCYKNALSQLKKQKKQEILLKSEKSDKQNIKSDSISTGYYTNTRMIKSVQDQTTICSFKNVTMIEQDDIGETMKDYNGDLMAKLQKMYSAIGVLNQEIYGLKQTNNGLAQSNKRKEKRLRLLEREFREFCLNYQFTISG